MVRLADYTTLHIGGQPRSFLEPQSESELINAVSSADDEGRDVVILGGGSNILFDDKFAGDVIRVAHSGIDNDSTVCAGAWVTVQAGHSWDDVVATAVNSGWTGLEGLSGIPGTAGATPLQNVGAYGQQVGDTIAQVRVWDRKSREIRTLFAADCAFEYRSSVFKSDQGRWIVLAVVFQLPLGTMSEPVMYDELSAKLDVEKGTRVPMVDVRDAVLDLRRGKGMVVDPGDHDTWSVGSYFLNPRVNQPPEDAVAWEQPNGTWKVSAAWLIEQAGFTRGFSLEPEVSLSTKHTLAITNRGGATAGQVLALAEHIRSGVRERFGIDLEVEPRVVR